MYVQINEFLESHKIVFNHQFGFQRNKSTSLAILDVYAKLINAVEEKNIHVAFSLISQKLSILLIITFF